MNHPALDVDLFELIDAMDADDDATPAPQGAGAYFSQLSIGQPMPVDMTQVPYLYMVIPNPQYQPPAPDPCPPPAPDPWPPPQPYSDFRQPLAREDTWGGAPANNPAFGYQTPPQSQTAPAFYYPADTLAYDPWQPPVSDPWRPPVSQQQPQPPQAPPLQTEPPMPWKEDTRPPSAEPQPKSQKPPGKAGRVISLVLNILVFVVCFVIIGSAVVFIFTKEEKRSFFGYRFYNVLSESMTPTPQADGQTLPGGFYKNDVIIVKIATEEGVKIGDIITFDTGETNDSPPLTHRVIDIEESPDGTLLFYTKGDHNATPDLVPANGTSIIGVKVGRIPKVGWLLGFAQAHLGWVIVICVVLILLVFGLFILFYRKFGGETDETAAQTEDEPLPPPPAESMFAPLPPLPAESMFAYGAPAAFIPPAGPAY
ncbi:MAG: signal peptidase I [Oscillospiraceae bacterium]|jgi:signal peptidase|nr:signal peptidase I [Oscillospiraceae bacterium]